MKRLKLQHNYHDALILAVSYRNDEDVLLDIRLCGCCNSSAESVMLSFLGLRNFSEVHELFEKVRVANSVRMSIDEIVGICRDDKRGFLLDLMTAGTVHIDAHGIHEA